MVHRSCPSDRYPTLHARSSTTDAMRRGLASARATINRRCGSDGCPLCHPPYVTRHSSHAGCFKHWSSLRAVLAAPVHKRCVQCAMVRCCVLQRVLSANIACERRGDRRSRGHPDAAKRCQPPPSVPSLLAQAVQMRRARKAPPKHTPGRRLPSPTMPGHPGRTVSSTCGLPPFCGRAPHARTRSAEGSRKFQTRSEQRLEPPASGRRLAGIANNGGIAEDLSRNLDIA